MTRRVPGVGILGASMVLPVAAALATRRWRRMSARLFDLEIDAETAAVRERVRESEARAHRHALANALTAVEGAALILDRDDLGPSDRQALRRVLDSGVERLRRLATREEGAAEPRVGLAGVASRLADDARWVGLVHVEVSPDVFAVGSAGETAAAATQLLAYASRRAPAGPITVRAARSGDWALLWVEDRAPAPSPRRRRAVIGADGRRMCGAEDISLHVATRIVRGQGGELLIELRPGGGCSFGIRLPAAGGGTGATPAGVGAGLTGTQGENQGHPRLPSAP